MKLRKKEDFDGKYWDNGIHCRWDQYLFKVAELAAEINPNTVLEIGTNGIGLYFDSDSMGITPKTNPTFLHDATVAPWPFKDKQYDLGIATQVWEHLGTGQTVAFGELQRTCKKAILSFPYLWQCDPTDCHYNITAEKINEWTNNCKYSKEYVIYYRLIRLYEF